LHFFKEKQNFHGIGAKHSTSKIKEYSDLENIKTFGFRGEALSSLCALSNVTLTTRHASSEYGTKISFNHEGEIVSESICARNIGTTVSVSEFFKTLPVRKAEFQKNYKKEFNKMVQLLQEYCLVLTGVKIICTNQLKSGNRSTVLQTNGQSVLENIISIFGPKQSQEIIKIKNPTEDGTEDGAYTQQSIVDLDDPNSILDIKESAIYRLNQSRFKIQGYISNIDHSCGRNAKDRQFFYVNSRPVEIRPIIKIANEVYRRYNMKHFPFVYLNLKMQQSSVDINLSKDKRQVAVCDDKILNLLVKRSLLNTFGELPAKFRYGNLNNSLKSVESEVTSDEDDKIMIMEPNSNFGECLKAWKVNPKDPMPSNVPSQKRKPNSQIVNNRFEKTPKIDILFSKTQKSEEDVSFKIDCKPVTQENTLRIEKINSNENSAEETSDFIPSKIISNESFKRDIALSSTISNNSSKIETDSEIVQLDSPRLNETFSRQIDLTIELIETESKIEEELHEKHSQTAKEKSYRLKFKESIDPTKNKKAEAELEAEIKKDTFSKMKIIGQFNLGFIIAEFENNLFIVDQHATDERYNFETLQKSLRLESQNLVVPENLELTSIQEDIVAENVEIFEMNGFKFSIDMEAEPKKKIKLISRPYSKNWEFGKEDIEEMIFLLQDSPHVMCRPTRIRTMLASRACRKSVMIGDSLDHKQMKRLITNMGEIDHPWVLLFLI
jgi:DNA mismatch repair protein PMS2